MSTTETSGTSERPVDAVYLGGRAVLRLERGHEDITFHHFEDCSNLEQSTDVETASWSRLPTNASACGLCARRLDRERRRDELHHSDAAEEVFTSAQTDLLYDDTFYHTHADCPNLNSAVEVESVVIDTTNLRQCSLCEGRDTIDAEDVTPAMIHEAFSHVSGSSTNGKQCLPTADGGWYCTRRSGRGRRSIESYPGDWLSPCYHCVLAWIEDGCPDVEVVR